MSAPRILQMIEGGRRNGAAAVLLTLAEGLRDQPFCIHYGVFRDNPLAAILDSRGFEVQRLPIRRRIDLVGIAHLIRMLHRERYDLVHTHLSRATWNGCIAGRLCGLPVLATAHSLEKRMPYALATHVIAVCEAVRFHLASQGIPNSRVSVVYNGIPIAPQRDAAEKQAAQAALGVLGAELVVGCASRAVEEKGVDVALRTVALLRGDGVDAKLLFAGDGDALSDLNILSRDLGLAEHVVFLGYISDIRQVLAALDVFLLPTRREGFSIAILEAMAAGIPCVAASVGGIPESLADATGKIVDGHDPEDYQNAICELIKNPAATQQMVCDARKRLEQRFTMQSMSASTAEVYTRLLKFRAV